MRPTLYAEWGHILRTKREAAELTQQALADAAGCTKAHISNIERGKCSVSDSLRVSLAAALSTTAAELFPYPDAA